MTEVFSMLHFIFFIEIFDQSVSVSVSASARSYQAGRSHPATPCPHDCCPHDCYSPGCDERRTIPQSPVRGCDDDFGWQGLAQSEDKAVRAWSSDRLLTSFLLRNAAFGAGRLMNASGCFQSVSKGRKLDALAGMSKRLMKKYASIGCSAGVVVFHPDAPDGEQTTTTTTTTLLTLADDTD